MSASRIRYLFDKYIKNECSPSEHYEFSELVRENRHDGELKDLLRELVVNTGAEHTFSEGSANAILSSILSSGEQQPVKIRSLRNRNMAKWLSVAAAAVILLIVIGYAVKPAGKKDIISVTGVATAPNLVTVHTSTGESKVVKLPDGTKIWMNPSSSLEYPMVFSNQEREVRLSGEAFFEVAHNPHKPFIIHSGALQTKVLGTSFNIQAYDSQENIAVTVVTGRVKVSNDKRVDSIELLPNQRVVFDKKTDKLIKENTSDGAAPDILKRKVGTFVYRDEPLQKLAKDIEAYFGVKIRLSEAIRHCGVVASFEITDKPEAILELIAISINGTLEVEDNGFTIYGDACPK
ncbi:MAG: FecR domain-containing protein [Chitinophagaceae bacterium]|nr:FecR domain-containing protein [Chitinophagaceae bacterium]